VTPRDERPRVHPETIEALRAWFEANQATSRGIWLVSWRRRTGRPTLSYEDVIREALCFGWIDGQAKMLDEERAMILLAPRSPRSGWARTNKVRVEELIASGRMQPAGLAAIEAARSNGAWSALDASESGIPPADLADALAALPGATAAWDAWAPSLRKMAIAHVTTAKRPETRGRRIAEIASRAAAGRKPFDP